MHILFITDNFPPETNASATRVYERACYWIKWGHQVTVVTSAPNFPQGRVYDGYRNRWWQVEDMSGIRVVRVKTFISPNRGRVRRSLDFLSFLVTGFFGGALQKTPDVVCATSPQFFAALAGRAVAARHRAPFVFELGDLWPASISEIGALRENLALRLLEKIELFLYRKSAAVAALTPAFKANLVARGIGGDKIAVVINGVDTWRYGPRARDADLARAWGLEDKFVVGYVGTHGMAHGLGNVLDAAALLRDLKEFRFLLVGDGAERPALVARARDEGLDNVVFAPPQPKDAMPRVWSLCDAALVHLRDLPVFSTVIPSKIFEAMASGLPVLLAAPTGEASRMIEADKAGLCVPAGDPEALAAAARRLMEDPGTRRALAEASLAAAPGHSREAQAEHMLRVLEAAARGDGAQAGAGEGP